MIIVKIGRRLCLRKTFQVVYDDMKTVSFSGDLKANFSDDVTLESAELSVVIQTMCRARSLNFQRLN
jgi:hypothetical protein